MLITFSPIMFTLVAVLIGGWVFSKEPDASAADIYVGGALYGGILSAFFAGVQFAV